MPDDRFPIAYFVTFSTYGHWVHYDVRGSDPAALRVVDLFHPPKLLIARINIVAPLKIIVTNLPCASTACCEIEVRS